MLVVDVMNLTNLRTSIENHHVVFYLVVDETTVFELGRFKALQNLAEFSDVVF